MEDEIKKSKIVIVGLGAAGGVLFGELAEAGLEVVAIEAGPFWDTDKDFVSDEREMRKERWNDPRISTGEDPLDIGFGTSGKGVGGGTVHYTMMSLRLHPSDFKIKTTEGVGEDWPISYEELEPYYDKIEDELPISGPSNFPWGGRKKPYPMEAHSQSCIDGKFEAGAEKLNLKVAPCPLALITEPLSGRQPCINRGFCSQGCKPKAKSSTLVTYVPRGVKAGGRVISQAMVKKINLSDDGQKVRSIVYEKGGKDFEIECEILILCAFSVETPRLLLSNKSDMFPNGLANSSGAVGKYLLCHSDHIVFAKFNSPVRQYRNPPTTSLCEDFYETDTRRGFKRGFSIAPYSSRPISFASAALGGRDDLWGKKLTDFMKEYNFWMQLGMIGEVLPNAENRVELSDEIDACGMPVPRSVFSYGQNEKSMIEYAYKKMEEIAKASGAVETFRSPLAVHILGTTRMGDNPQSSVVDKNLKAHDLGNMYICGGSVFPSGGAVNPTLTIEALALRLASHLKSLG